MLQHRHQVQIVPRAFTARGVPHGPLIDESQTLVEMAGPGVVVVDIEKESMRLQVFKRDADYFGQDPPAQPLSGCGNHNAFQFDGPVVFAQSTEDDVGLQPALVGVADQVACIGAGEGRAMALLAPLADKLPGEGCLFQGGDGKNVFSNRRTQKHEP